MTTTNSYNTSIDLSTIGLIIFGDFNVLTNTPFRDHRPLHMKDGRVEYLEELRQRYTGLKFAVCGNKGGVPFGKQTEEEGREEVRWTAEQIGADTFAVCFAHPTPGKGFEKYANPAMLANRKPEPGMFLQVIKELGFEELKHQVLAVGTSEDRHAAEAAGIAWQWTDHFFKPAVAPRPADDFDPFLDTEDL